MEVITYETLYELLRREKSKSELQKLNDNFFEKIVSYLKEKRNVLESQRIKSDVFSSTEVQRTKRQIDNIQKILKELYERREAKIIQLALFSSRAKDEADTSMMLEQEKGFFESILNLLNIYRNNILLNILSERLPIAKDEPKELKTNEEEGKKVKFIQAVPMFVGHNLNVYGPFEENNVSELPAKIVDFLIKNKKAKLI